MADTVVDLGNGAPSMSMNEFMFGQKFPGPVYEEGEIMMPLEEQGLLNPDVQYEFFVDPSVENEELQTLDRFDPYEDNPSFAKPMYDTSNPEDALFLFNATARDRKGPEIALGEGGIADLPPDFGTTEGEIDDFDMMTLGKEPTDRGISGLLMYEGLAPPQYPMRPIQKQKFGKKRGFQFGQMVQLNDRDGAVGGKLLKQAGIQASVDEVRSNLDPKVVDQMSRILGRDIG